ncbi:MAG TPA: M14 family zinc carboxypeptidase, partial [Archangium sp.]
MTPLLLALLTAAPPLTTVAEESGWLRTGRYEEVERLCAAFPKRYPGKVKCERFGVTPLGRPMLMLVASADGVFTPEQARAKKRPVLLVQGGIHAGEIDGKDAGFWLLRELLEGKVAPKSLSAVTLVFVPVFNVDGHER